jgi:hypothetical protein
LVGWLCELLTKHLPPSGICRQTTALQPIRWRWDGTGLAARRRPPVHSRMAWRAAGSRRLPLASGAPPCGQARLASFDNCRRRNLRPSSWGHLDRSGAQAESVCPLGIRRLARLRECGHVTPESLRLMQSPAFAAGLPAFRYQLAARALLRGRLVRWQDSWRASTSLRTVR